MIFLQLFLTFLKIGVVSFGGGYAMIPFIQDEVISNGWLTADEILNFIAISESTPGPVAINMATFVGASQGGFFGALLATLGVVLPSFVIILTIATIITGLLKYAGVKAFLDGLKPVVVGLILGTGITIFLQVILSFANISSNALYFDWKALVIFTVVLLTHVIYKKQTKKAISPILLIIISAALGILFYGLIP